MRVETDNYVLMEIPFVNNIPFFELITNIDYEKNEIFLNIIESYEFLLDAINILNKKNIVHFDLKGNNILFNKTTDTPQIIDFGLSIPIKDIDSKNIKKYFYIYSPDYYIWPLEVHVICFLFFYVFFALIVRYFHLFIIRNYNNHYLIRCH